ncbi:MAG: hypothetical protein JXA57_06840 [Armatimonadetes bacterium]|nr:hypothetical protein [Armatimonadota bacterium]
MIDIPADIQIRSTLRSGSVLCYREDAHHDPKFRYFVVLNPQPEQDEELVLVTATSQIDKARVRTARNPSTLVLVTPSEYPEFTEDQSAFDCNNAYVKAVGQLVAKLEASELSLHAYMPTEIVVRLRQGVRSSLVVDRRTKALLDE